MKHRADLEAGAPRLSLGYLAALPLFLAYEAGQALAPSGGVPRASAELVVARVLAPFEGKAQLLRLALLLVCAALAWLRLARAGEAEGPELRRALGRQTAEGLLAGFLLGPLLFLLQGWLAAEPLRVALAQAPALGSILRLIGAAPWEELLFRVGLYGIVYLVVRQGVSFLGLQSLLARFGAEFAALLVSALLFAWFHLDAAQRLLGTSGEPFHRGLFLWRVSAGLLLGGLFRWRGLGVAAWAHALFNLGIALGIRP